MSLIVTKITRQPEKDDKYQNWSYWAEFEGIDGGVLVSHKGHIDPLKVGDDAAAAGFERVDDVPKKNGGGTYKKLMRPAQQGGFGGGGGGGGGYRANPEDMRQRAAQGALSNAVALAAQFDGQVSSDETLKVADKLYAWIRAKAEGK